MNKKLWWLFPCLLLNVSACSAEDGGAPAGWDIMTEKKYDACLERHADSEGYFLDNPDISKNCVGHRPPPTQEELNWLKDYTQKRLIKVKGGEFIMGDFGALHTKDSTPPVSTELGYVYEGADSQDKGKKTIITHNIGSAYTMDGGFTEDLYGVHPHPVRLDDFTMGAYMVEEQEYNLYGASKGEPLLKSAHRPSYADFLKNREAPAAVTWEQAQGYCQWLGEQINQPMSLPTDAQWEYAGRNRGEFRVYPTNNGRLESGVNIIQYDLYSGFPRDNEELKKFKSMPPNPLGFYNMLNLTEWMADWYMPEYDLVSPIDNPKGPEKGLLYKEIPSTVERSPEEDAIELKVVRGTGIMSWLETASFMRNFGLPSAQNAFRCVVNQ